MIGFRHPCHIKVQNAAGVVFVNEGLYSHTGFSHRPLLLPTLATAASVGKVQFTCMLLWVMTGYLIVIKIPWNYGKLIFHAHSDYILSNNATALACPLDFFVFHFSGSSFSSWYFRSPGALPNQASLLHAAAPLSSHHPSPGWVPAFAQGPGPLL